MEETPLKPKIFFDTNVCGKLILSPYCGSLPEIQSRLTRRFTQYVSPNTFVELLDAIKGGSGAQFESDQERLRIMAVLGNHTFFNFL
jgi:hypothetical protein